MKKRATQEIIVAKRTHLAHRKAETPMEAMRALAGMQKRPQPILSTVTDDGVLFFGQIRYGVPGYDPVAQALRYVRSGMDAVALFTDNALYEGGVNDLALLTRATDVPIVLQNYIFDEYQVIEARAAGAAAVTLIARLLEPGALRTLISATQRNRMSALVRVADERELATAIDFCPTGVEIGGRGGDADALDIDLIHRLYARVPSTMRVLLYNRLHTFAEAEALAPLQPDAVTISAELLAQPDALPRLREIFAA